MKDFLTKNRLLILLILAGVIFRLFFLLFIHHIFDFRNILAIMKSVADTGNLTEGFFVLKRNSLEVQLYGKIFYQLGAIWLKILQAFGLINVNYIYDTQPFEIPSAYMIGFQGWNPQLYQQIAIKLSQFFYDFIFLYFFYRLASIISPSKKYLAVLFWAFNPFLCFVTYAMFQADIAMLAFFTAGITLSLESFQVKAGSKLKYKIAALACLALGAVIKQVPILFVPFALVLLSESIVSFGVLTAAFTFFYTIFSQPWAPDVTLIKQFLITSRESLALFNFQLNSISIFLLLYVYLFILTVFLRKKFINNPINLVYLVTALIIVIFIGEDNSFLFPQFNIWIMPFIFLASLVRPEYLLFFIAPLIGFFKRSMIDNDFLSGSLSQSYGSLLADLPKYQQLLHFSVNTILVDYVLTTIMIALYLVLLYFLLGEFGILPIKKFSQGVLDFMAKYYVKILLTLVLSYFLVIGVDYFIKSKYVILRGGMVQEEMKEFHLNGNKLTIDIDNPYSRSLNGIELKAVRKSIFFNDSVVLNFTDRTTNKTLLVQKVFDYMIPQTADDVVIPLNKPLNSKKIRMELYKENNQNDIVVFRASIVTDPKLLKVSQSIPIAVDYHGTPIQIRFRGQYPVMYAGYVFVRSILEKPSFFIGYFSLILVLVALTLGLSKLKEPRK